MREDVSGLLALQRKSPQCGSTFAHCWRGRIAANPFSVAESKSGSASRMRTFPVSPVFTQRLGRHGFLAREHRKSRYFDPEFVLREAGGVT